MTPVDGDEPPPRVAKVVLDSPLPRLDHLFDYRIPEAMAAEAVPGARVKVPLRVAGRVADGWIVAITDRTEAPGELSALDRVVSAAPVLAPEVWRLARAVADRGAGVASDVLRIAVPKRQARVEQRWLAAVAAAPEPDAGPAVPVQSAHASSAPVEPVFSGPGSFGPAPVEPAPGGTFPADPARAEPGAAAAAAAVPAPAEPPAVRADSRDQLADALLAGGRLAALPTPHLVQVGPAETAGAWVGGWAADIARIAAAIAAAGRSTIVAVPDRRDLDQLDTALAAGPVAALVLRIDASRQPAARYRAHLTALGPGPHVIIGNRSAVYAPAADLGAIVVWEEADGFHQEPLAPYAATRDVALLRQEQSGAGLLLLSSSRSTTVQRLVELGWFGDWELTRARPEVVLTPDDGRGGRIPSAAFRAVQRGLLGGPVLVQVSKPGDAALRALRAGEAPVPIDAGRTAHELGRAFPGVPVLVADGDHVHDTVEPGPRLVVATRGAEPRAPGGYRAVLLLDGGRMLLRESLWVAEDCLRWWSSAAMLAAEGAPVHLVGVSGDVATALATWRSADFAARQLVDRRALRFPPAVRVAAATGPVRAVEQLVEAWTGAGADLLSRVPAEQGERAVVRFGVRAGPAVASVAKAALIKHGSARRPKPPAPPAPALRVRFDPHEL